jgi:hypothetical protein
MNGLVAGSGGRPIALGIAKVWRDVGMDTMPGIVAGLSVCLQPRKVFLDALADGVGAVRSLARLHHRARLSSSRPRNCMYNGLRP